MGSQFLKYVKGKVSIITVYYNRMDAVKESINSLISQSYKNCEIIVVNDGSTDCTLDEINKFSHVSNLKIIDKKNTGFVDSIYEAIESTDSEYVAIHGSGDISLPRRIESQIDLLKSNFQVGVVGVHCEVVNEVTNKTSSLCLYEGVYQRPTKMLRKGNFITQGEVTFRRDIYDIAGKYNKLYKYSQDYDLWLRMSHYCDFYIIPEILYKRFSRKDGVSGNIGKVILQQYLVCFARQCDENGIKKPHPIELILVKSDWKFKKRLLRLLIKGFVCGANSHDYQTLLYAIKKEFGWVLYFISMIILKYKIRK